MSNKTAIITRKEISRLRELRNSIVQINETINVRLGNYHPTDVVFQRAARSLKNEVEGIASQTTRMLSSIGVLELNKLVDVPVYREPRTLGTQRMARLRTRCQGADPYPRGRVSPTSSIPRAEEDMEVDQPEDDLDGLIPKFRVQCLLGAEVSNMEIDPENGEIPSLVIRPDGIEK